MRVACGIAAAFMLATIAACTPDGSDPAPVRSQSYVTYLQEYLATGACKVSVAIWTEEDRTAANTYVRANGDPTDACPNPDVRVVVNDDPSLKNGQNVQGRVIIRYAYDYSYRPSDTSTRV